MRLDLPELDGPKNAIRSQAHPNKAGINYPIRRRKKAHKETSTHLF